MFERFSTDCRRVLVYAQERATQRGDEHIGTEHLLLGVLDVDPELVELAVEPGTVAETVRLRVEAATRPPGTQPAAERRPRKAEGASRSITFSPNSKAVLEQGLREALRLGHKSIEVGHILLGLRTVEECTASQVLRELGFSLARLGDVQDALRSRMRTSRLQTSEFETPEPRLWTPGGKAALFIARQLSEHEPISTMVLLRALLREGNGLAARALARLGVDEASIEATLADLDAGSTSDAPPEPEEVKLRIGEVEGTFVLPAEASPEARARLRDAVASGRLEAVMREALLERGVDPDDPPVAPAP